MGESSDGFRVWQLSFKNGCFLAMETLKLLFAGALAGETVSVHSVLEVIQVNCDYNLKKACKQIEKLLEGKALLSAKESHIKVLERSSKYSKSSWTILKK